MITSNMNHPARCILRYLRLHIPKKKGFKCNLSYKKQMYDLVTLKTDESPTDLIYNTVVETHRPVLPYLLF